MEPIELLTKTDPGSPAGWSVDAPPFARATRAGVASPRWLAPRKIGGNDWRKHTLILALLGLELLPLYLMLQTSVKDGAAADAHPWWPAGFGHWQARENFSAASHLIFPLVSNTLFVAVLGTLGTVVLALGAAYFFARFRMPGSGLIWSAFLALLLLPTVANIVPLFALLASWKLVNSLWALVILSAAAGQVFNICILRNSIENIPRDLFEAAELDGANHFQQLRRVVLPLCGSMIGTLAVLSFLGTWNDFLMPYILLRDPHAFTLGAGLVHLDGESVKSWGQTMAAYMLASLPVGILSLATRGWFIRGLGGAARR